MVDHAPGDLGNPCFGLSETEIRDEKRYETALKDPTAFSGTPYPVDPVALAAIYAGPSREEIITYGRKENPVSRPGGTFEIADYTQVKDGVSEREQVTVALENYLDPLSPSTPATVAAVDRLKTLFFLRKFRNWGPDVVYKAFYDLDRALFDGKLRFHTKITWRNEADCVKHAGKTLCNGYTSFQYRIKVQETHQFYGSWCAEITLNATSIFLLPPLGHDTRWDEMWDTLLHEMVHCYLRICAPHATRSYSWVELDNAAGPGHGEYFQRCLRAVGGRAWKILRVQGLFRGQVVEKGSLKKRLDKDWKYLTELIETGVYDKMYDDEEKAGNSNEAQAALRKRDQERMWDKSDDGTY